MYTVSLATSILSATVLKKKKKKKTLIRTYALNADE